MQWIDFVEAGFNRAFGLLAKKTQEGFMTLSEKINELQQAASQERLQVSQKIGELTAEIQNLKELTAGNETIVGQLTARLNEKDSEIAALEARLAESQNEINESVAALDGAIAEVQGIFEPEVIPEPEPNPEV